jgi:SAM-dependent methyltransferase
MPGFIASLECRKILEILEVAARKRRHAFLLRILHAFEQPPEILDVGGTVDYWLKMKLPKTSANRLVLLNTFEQRVCEPFESVVGDGRDLSCYSTDEFDLVFSNSVIGHVGDFSDQMKMASEVRRVGKHFFLQAPNHGFPLDWRTLVPLFHFLSPPLQTWCFEHFAVGRYHRANSAEEAMSWATRIRNIRRTELPRLFPNATVVNERVLGLTKSFIVHNLKTSDTKA